MNAQICTICKLSRTLAFTNNLLIRRQRPTRLNGRMGYSKAILRNIPLFDMQQSASDYGDMELEMEREYSEMKQAVGLPVAVTSEQLLLVHPRVRWGSGSAPKHTTPELQVEEAQALCQTIPQFRVVNSIIVNTDYNVRKKLIWGEGRLEAIQEHRQQYNVSALFINVDALSPLQQRELTAYFGVPIYDRFNIVLTIFKLYAKTREARLQIALAEIPYIRNRVKFLNQNSDTPAQSLQIASTSSEGSSKRLEVLRLREQSIRKQIRHAMESTKQIVLDIKEKSGPAKVPVIGVVGYTNAGKTTLIKKLTNSQTLFGENRLFATLDTTTHPATLPSSNKVILADTIGFISNLPIQLIASFSATLQHVENADLLLHVMDLSHPDLRTQKENVLVTLESLNVRRSLIDNIVDVGNKLDKCDQERREQLAQWGFLPPNGDAQNSVVGSVSSRLFPISCRTLEGMAQLIEHMDKSVQFLNGSRVRHLRLAHSSKAIPYLYQEGLVTTQPETSECGNYLLFEVLMNDAQFAKFQAAIGTRLKRRKTAGLQKEEESELPNQTL